MCRTRRGRSSYEMMIETLKEDSTTVGERLRLQVHYRHCRTPGGTVVSDILRRVRISTISYFFFHVESFLYCVAKVFHSSTTCRGCTFETKRCVVPRSTIRACNVICVVRRLRFWFPFRSTLILRLLCKVNPSKISLGHFLRMTSSLTINRGV